MENTQGDKAGGIDGSSQQPLEGRTGRGVLAKQLILCLCFLTQHPHTWSSSSCLTAGEEEEELLMEHVSKTCSAKAQPPTWEIESLADHSHTCLCPHKRGNSVYPHIHPESQQKKTRQLELAREGQGSMLWPPLCPKVTAESGKSQTRGPCHYFQKMLKEISSSNLSTQSPGRPQGQKQPFCSYSTPSSPSLSTKNNFLLGVRVGKKKI